MGHARSGAAAKPFPHGRLQSSLQHPLHHSCSAEGFELKSWNLKNKNIVLNLILLEIIKADPFSGPCCCIWKLTKLSRRNAPPLPTSYFLCSFDPFLLATFSPLFSFCISLCSASLTHLTSTPALLPAVPAVPKASPSTFHFFGHLSTPWLNITKEHYFLHCTAAEKYRKINTSEKIQPTWEEEIQSWPELAMGYWGTHVQPFWHDTSNIYGKNKV